VNYYRNGGLQSVPTALGKQEQYDKAHEPTTVRRLSVPGTWTPLWRVMLLLHKFALPSIVPAQHNRSFACTWMSSSRRLPIASSTHTHERHWITSIKNVPARVCLETGERFFSPETVARLQQTIWEQRKPKRVIETPVFEFA
jgi:hypothetical protein